MPKTRSEKLQFFTAIDKIKGDGASDKVAEVEEGKTFLAASFTFRDSNSYTC